MEDVPIDDEGGDEELRIAIALSMQQQNNNNEDNNAKPAVGVKNSGITFDCKSFHKLIWDDARSTQNDKERWIYECISTPFLQRQMMVGGGGGGKLPTTMQTSSPFAAAAASSSSGGGMDDAVATAPLTPLEIFTGSNNTQHRRHHQQQSNTPPKELWGLTQKHGGPCGVLAAVQAEMIRILLFGRGGGKRDLYFPFSPKANENYKQCEMAEITPVEVQESMAMAIGMILARAALMPPAAATKGSLQNYDKSSVRLVLPDGSGSSAQTDAQSTTTSASSWIQEMLSSPSKSESMADTMNTSANPSSSGLSVHIIDAAENDASSATATTTNHDASPVALTKEQTQMIHLAKKVANFLLGDGMGVTKTPTTPLECFQGPGGVMFLVMSLVETRGIDRIRCDMDDPNTTITAQFGHSSQELMNLLLTGQALSNVFDNSMSLSEDLSCHGIQRRPAIGYLSILESLRYCEVGGFYKSPLFPIWVIGSTSHFSVLFGDEVSL